MMTDAPRRPSLWTIARPIPRLPPVTNATCPSRLNALTRLHSSKVFGGFKVIDCQLWDDALDQSLKNLAGTDFQRAPAAQGIQLAHRLLPADRTHGLAGQKRFDAALFQIHLGFDVRDHTDCKWVHLHLAQDFFQPLGGGTHQLAMKGGANG